MLDRLSSLAEKTIQSMGDVEAKVGWEKPQERTHGDYATSIALKVAKPLGKAPKEVAEAVAVALRGDPGVANVEIAGPGYVNVWLTPAALLSMVPVVTGAMQKKVTRKEAPVIVEYSQPNIAKPLGIHHILSTVIGQTISNFYEHAGTPVLRWNYIGDWGTQFGKLAVAMEKWGAGKTAKDLGLDGLLALYVQFHQEVEKDASLEEQGRAAFQRLEQGDKALRAFWQDVLTVTKASLQSIYGRLHVSFDLDLGESFYEDKMDTVLAEGKKKKVFKEGEAGALIVEFPESQGYPPYLVLKGDGATLYSTRDIAQMRYRIDTYHPQRILICTDIAQKLHFEQLVATCAQLGWELPPFENVLFGRMRFADKSMSTRKGNILKLEHVLDEAVARAEEVIAARGDAIQTDDPKGLAEMMGVGALVYGILSQNRKMDLVFDWDKMLSFEGNSAPYLMYTHARCRSVLRKSGVVDPTLPASVPAMEEEERLLLGTLLQFPSVLEEALRDHLPHKLANYLHTLSQEANTFYVKLPILKAEEPARTLRLALTSLTADVLRAGAELLTLRLPDAM